LHEAADPECPLCRPYWGMSGCNADIARTT
jgi:hypothetical protein